MKTLFFLMVLPACTGGTSIHFDKAPLLILGREAGDAEPMFWGPRDIVISKSGLIYVLDTKASKIIKLSFTGEKLAEFSQMGSGPGELKGASALGFFGNELWVVDKGNGRIVVFQDDKYLRMFKLENEHVPEYMVIRGDHAYFSSKTFGGDFGNGGIGVYDQAGTRLRQLVWGKGRNKMFGETVGLWNSSRMTGLGSNRFLIGFIHDNALAILDDDGNVITDKDMSGFYERYSRKASNGDNFPLGYSAMAFSEGPGATILVATCDFKTKTCGQIQQFSPDLKGRVRKYDLGFTVLHLEYFADHGFLVLFNNLGEVIFYDTE